MARIGDRHHLVGRQVFLPGKQGVRNLDPLVGRIDIVAAQQASHVVARVMHTLYDNQQSGLCLMFGIGMAASREPPSGRGKAPKNGTIESRLLILFF